MVTLTNPDSAMERLHQLYFMKIGELAGRFQARIEVVWIGLVTLFLLAILGWTRLEPYAALVNSVCVVLTLMSGPILVYPSALASCFKDYLVRRESGVGEIFLAVLLIPVLSLVVYWTMFQVRDFRQSAPNLIPFCLGGMAFGLYQWRYPDGLILLLRSRPMWSRTIRRDLLPYAIDVGPRFGLAFDRAKAPNALSEHRGHPVDSKRPPSRPRGR